MTEIWRDVVGYEGIYRVSSLGRVMRSGGGVRGAVVGRILREGVRVDGIRLVSLHRGNVATTRHIHVLVAAAFIGPRPTGMEVNHKSGDRADNSVENLEYVTGSENMQHAYRMALRVASNTAKTHCVNGHAFDEANTHIEPDGGRRCRTCGRERTRRYRGRAA